MGATPDEREAIAREWLAEVRPLVARGGRTLVLVALGLFVIGLPIGYVWHITLGYGSWWGHIALWAIPVILATVGTLWCWCGLRACVLRAARAPSAGSFLHEASRVVFWVEQTAHCADDFPDRAGALLLDLAPAHLPREQRLLLVRLSRFSDEHPEAESSERRKALQHIREALQGTASREKHALPDWVRAGC